MIKKLKNKKRILVPDNIENHESIKVPDRDVNRKIIYDSIKYYLKKFKKTKEEKYFFYVFELVEKTAMLNNLYGKYETGKCNFTKNIVESIKEIK